MMGKSDRYKLKSMGLNTHSCFTPIHEVNALWIAPSTYWTDWYILSITFEKHPPTPNFSTL